MRYTGLHVRRPSGYGRRVMALNIGIAGLGLAADGIVQQSQRGRERVATGRLRPHVQSAAVCGAHTGRCRRRSPSWAGAGGLMDARDNLAAVRSRSSSTRRSV